MNKEVSQALYQKMVSMRLIVGGVFKAPGEYEVKGLVPAVIKEYQELYTLPPLPLDIYSLSHPAYHLGQRCSEPEVIFGVNHQVRIIVPFEYINDMLEHKEIIYDGSVANEKSLNSISDFMFTWLDAMASSGYFD